MLGFSFACESITQPKADTEANISVNDAAIASAKAKVDICHNTSSKTNPWILISVSEASREKHISKHGDLIPGERIDDETVISEQCVVEEDPINNGEGEGEGNTAGEVGMGDGDDSVNLP